MDLNEGGIMAGKEISAEMENMFLNFSIGDEVYGIEVKYILQIIGMQPITEIPKMPYGMKGLIRLRDNVIPVFSLRMQFGKEEIEATDRTCIIVVQVDQEETGLIVDAILETISIEPESIASTPAVCDRTAKSYVMGIAKLQNAQNVALIDLEELLSAHGRHLAMSSGVSERDD